MDKKTLRPVLCFAVRDDVADTYGEAPGLFHCWGVHQYWPDGHGLTVAIVELSNGRVIRVRPDNLKFTD